MYEFSLVYPEVIVATETVYLDQLYYFLNLQHFQFQWSWFPLSCLIHTFYNRGAIFEEERTLDVLDCLKKMNEAQLIELGHFCPF